MADETPALAPAKKYAVLGFKGGKPTELLKDAPLADARQTFNATLKLADKFDVIELRGPGADESYRQATITPQPVKP